MGSLGVIILDTHVWIWWVHDDPQLPLGHKSVLKSQEPTGLGISAISCWEVAKLVEYGRLRLSEPLPSWMEKALSYPGIQVLPLTPEIAIESTQLPQPFHKDPADQIIVATARIYDLGLMTCDIKILAYPHVVLAP